MIRLIASLLLAYGLTVAGAYETAFAQAPQGSQSTPAGYDAEVDRGLAEFDAGNFAEARSHFIKAHELFPNARTMRAIGKVEYELKNYAQAARYFELALASSVRPLTPEQRAEARQLLDGTRGYLSRYTISTVPPDATLLLDGNPVRLPADRTLVLAVGDHVLEARAEGYQPERRKLQVVGGSRHELTIELHEIAREASPLVAPMPPPPQKDDDTGSRKKWWLVTGAVAAVVAGGVVASVLLLRKDREPGEPLGGNTGTVITLGLGARE